MSIEVRGATPALWGDLVAVFGRRGDDPAWCWCRRFLGGLDGTTGAQEQRPDKRRALHDEIAHTLFTGTASMFVAAGFAEAGRTYPTRPVMRLSLKRRYRRGCSAATRG
ncbi:MAG TPA: hypothetical protein VI434_05470 [Candidatus Dormibacteraeota bacterium]